MNAKTKIAFFFEYGVVVFWGLTAAEEQTAMRELMSSCELEALPVNSVEVDSMFFTFSDPSERTYRPSPSPSFDEVEASFDEEEEGVVNGGGALRGGGAAAAAATTTVLKTPSDLLSSSSSSSPRRVPSLSGGGGSGGVGSPSPGERSRVADDVVIIPPEQQGDAAIMLAASHSLAQSTKLALYESNAARLVEQTEHLPGQMANDGELSLSIKDATKLRGQIFLQRADLNLLSTVLDVPDFFWAVPDRYCRLYEEMRVYLELDTRVEVLNQRLNVMESLAAAVNQELENKNSSRLEWIVIWLIVIEVVIGLFEIIALHDIQ